MPIYRIADLNISINPKYKRTAQRLEPYKVNADTYDFEINLTDEEITSRSKLNSNPCIESEAESVLILTQLCTRVLAEYSGFFFHSSSLMLDGEAYVFTAKSGTGKSTHTALWREHFGNRVTMINDDKPIIRKKDGKFKIYGTPWMGKSDIGTNTSAPVKAVYILRRGKENSAERVSVGEVFKDLLEATVIPSDKKSMTTLLGLLDEFFSKTPVYILNCTMDIEAVTTAYNIANQQNN